MYTQNNCTARSRPLSAVFTTTTRAWDGEEGIGLNSKYSSHLHPYLLNTHSCKVLIFWYTPTTHAYKYICHSEVPSLNKQFLTIDLEDWYDKDKIYSKS